MSSAFVSIKDSPVMSALRDIEDSLKSGAVITALEKGAEVLQAETRTQLRRKLGPGATSTLRRKKPMEKGVSLVVDREHGEVRVSILGDFRLKWFERGTEERYTRVSRRRKGSAKRYRGRIEALRFFESARSNESRVIETIENELTKQIENLIR